MCMRACVYVRACTCVCTRACVLCMCVCAVLCYNIDDLLKLQLHSALNISCLPLRAFIA